MRNTEPDDGEIANLLAYFAERGESRFLFLLLPC